MKWNWFLTYYPEVVAGVKITLLLFFTSTIIGFLCAVPLALAQSSPNKLYQILSQCFCTYIRGTPLLIQLWLLYYGIGSLFPLIPGIKIHFLWLVRLDAIYYAIFAFTCSFAGYTAVILSKALAQVPRGELEAAIALGLKQQVIFWKIHLPRALGFSLPAIAGETIAQLKATALAFTIPVIDLMAVVSKIRHNTLLIYEPLLVAAGIYIALAWALSIGFRFLIQRLSFSVLH